jgi:hypothetical protein
MAGLKPRDLVAESKVFVKRATWFDKLDCKQRQFIDEVVRAMKEDSDSKPRIVARLLIANLGIKRSERVVADLLKEKMNETN